ncbi:MAG: 2-oxo acid dehydrogenase subunit E2, partial [Paracoccaceae bacterium]
VEQLYAVIYPPQVAIVGVGTPTERAVVTEGRIEPRLGVTLTLAADHRVSDGHRGALFLRAIDKHLQAPETL